MIIVIYKNVDDFVRDVVFSYEIYRKFWVICLYELGCRIVWGICIFWWLWGEF